MSEEQLHKVLGLIEQGKKEGAKLCTGGARQGDKGYFVQPTVFSDVQDHHVIAQEEVRINMYWLKPAFRALKV